MALAQALPDGWAARERVAPASRGCPGPESGSLGSLDRPPSPLKWRFSHVDAESLRVRPPRGFVVPSRQRVVAYLGDLLPSEQDGWAKLGVHLQGGDTARRPEGSLFDPPCAQDAGEEEPVKVRLKDNRLERLRDFGDVWLAWGLWRMLGLDGLLGKLLPEGREIAKQGYSRDWQCTRSSSATWRLA